MWPSEDLTLYLWCLMTIVAAALAVRFKWRMAAALAPCFATVFLVELGIVLYEKTVLDPWEYTYKVSQPFQEPDPLLRRRLLPNTRAEESKHFANGQAVYDRVVYEIDARGRRATRNPETGAPAHHALFFGCSFTFGMGVPTDKTLPSAFARVSAGEFRAYNYGMGGNGPSQMYLRLEEDALFEDVTPRNGIAVYAFIPDQLSRATPYEYSRLIWIKDSPLFRLSPGGALAGPFYTRDDRDMSAALGWYQLLTTQSPLLRQVFRIHDRTFISEREALDIVARLVQESAVRYKKRFDGTFHVLIWPRVSEALRGLPHFIETLEGAGLSVLRVPPLPEGEQASIHPMDPHPGAAEYEWVAAQLYQSLSASAAPAVD